MKNKFKNLIYIMLFIVLLMPESILMAKDREIKIKNNIKQEIKIVNKVEKPIEIIEEVKIPEPEPIIIKDGYQVFSIDKIKEKICQVFLSECSNALIIASRESGYGQFSISKTKDYGVFQLNCRWQGWRVGGNCKKYFDIDTNIKIAKQIFDEQGWNPWTTKKYLYKTTF